MGLRIKDMLFGLIPNKKLRNKLRFLYGDFPYNSIVRNVKISMKKNLKLGKHIFIGGHSVLLCDGGIEIGSHTSIGPYVMIITANHNYKSEKLLPFDEINYTQKVSIGRNCWIGARTTICPGVKIEDGVVVAAGSVVTKSVPKCAIIGGNPAKIINFRDIETYNKLDKSGKSATLDEIANRTWIEIKEHKEFLKEVK